MKSNVGKMDRVIRVAVGAVLVWLGMGMEGVTSTVLMVVGAVVLLTGVLGWCALYKVLGTSTRKDEASSAGIANNNTQRDNTQPPSAGGAV